MKKGFTLIELLAVIVILAIIALIATPIVLNIIDESKENATLRSAEMYLDAVELSIAGRVMHHGGIDDGEYPIMNDGNICLGGYNETANPKTCAGKPIDSNNDKILKVEVKGEKPTNGKIVIKNGQIEKGIEEGNPDKITWLKIGDNSIKPIKGEDGKVKFEIVDSESSKEETIEVGKMSICNPLNVQTEGTYTAGDKYECDVDPNKDGYDYTFYVLNATSTEVNLIMDQNINSDGTPAGMTGTAKNGDNVYNLVAWNSSGPNTGGPVDAMQFLYNATKDWTNIDPITYEYKDKEYQGTTNANTSYTSFVVKDGVLTITELDGITTTIGSKNEPLRARMPIYSNDKTKTEVTSKANASYLYDNLNLTGTSTPSGYWTLSSLANNSSSSYAWNVDYYGFVSVHGVGDVDYCGVRAVINLKI